MTFLNFLVSIHCSNVVIGSSFRGVSGAEERKHCCMDRLYFFCAFPRFACLALLARFMLAVARPTNKKINVYYAGYYLIAVITEPSLAAVAIPGGGGSTWVFFGWVCATRDSKLAPRSKKNSPRNRPIFYTPF